MIWLRRGLWLLAFVIILLGVSAGALWLAALPAMGSPPEAGSDPRILESNQWVGNRFDNELPRIDSVGSSTLWEVLFGGEPFQEPEAPVALKTRSAVDFDSPPPLRVTWLGHSTLLVEIDGTTVMIDPVWGERASPLSFLGPSRFHPPPVALDQLPALDAIVISHDHYDHLDYPTVRKLLGTDVQWLVPLGVGSHLRAWGVNPDQVVELDWWEERTIGDVRLVCTPARHFSGRGLSDQNATLWAGWAFVGPEHRTFYSGDTALHPDFERIGRELGPFDLTMIESGAYNQAWADVHLGPEQAVLAHTLVNGKVMIPVHWGTFDLALHGWVEPVERVLAAAERLHVTVAVPRPGASVVPSDGVRVDRYWPSRPWRTAERAPAWSSAVPRLQTPLRIPASPEG